MGGEAGRWMKERNTAQPDCRCQNGHYSLEVSLPLALKHEVYEALRELE